MRVIQNSNFTQTDDGMSQKQTRYCSSTCIEENDALIIHTTYLGCKQHGWDVADHSRAKCWQTTEEAHNEGNGGKNERAATLFVHRSLQDGNLQAILE